MKESQTVSATLTRWYVPSFSAERSMMNVATHRDESCHLTSVVPGVGVTCALTFAGGGGVPCCAQTCSSATAGVRIAMEAVAADEPSSAAWRSRSSGFG